MGHLLALVLRECQVYASLGRSSQPRRGAGSRAVRRPARLSAVSRRAAWTFAALGIAWGIPYLLIKVAVGELSPSQLVLARTGLAAVLLLPVALARGQVPGVLRRWPAVLAYTILALAVPWVFLSRDEQQLPRSTTGLLISSEPLAGRAGTARTGRRERWGTSRWEGLLLGVLGV